MVLRLSKFLKLKSEYTFHVHFGFKKILLLHVQHLEKHKLFLLVKQKECVMKTMNYFQLNDYTVVYEYRTSRSVWTSFGSRLLLFIPNKAGRVS